MDDVHVHLHLDDLTSQLSSQLTQLKELLMAQIDDLRAAIAQVGTDIAEAVDRIQARLAALGEPDPDLSADIARLGELSSQIDALGAEAGTGTEPGTEPADPNAPHPDQTLPGDLPTSP